MRRWLGFGAALLPLAAHAALGPRYGGTASVDVSVSSAASFVPHAPASLDQAVWLGLVHAGLIRLRPDGRIEPDLAARTEVAASGREWTLALPEASFHDGSPVTPAAAAASLRRFLEGRSTAARRLAESLEPGTGPGTTASALVLRFRARFEAPLAPLASPAAAVTSPAGSGCGPFVPLVPVPGSVVLLPAFAGHVRGRPLLDAVRVRVSPRDRGALYRDPEVGGPPTAALLLVLDPRQPPFDDPAARARAARALPDGDLPRTFLRRASPARALVPGFPDALPVPELPSPTGADLSFRLAVTPDVPAAASQRVLALWGAAGLRAQVVTVPSDPRDPAPARLLVWRPEVAEPALALRELAELSAAPPAVHEALDGAELDEGPARAAALGRVEALLRAERSLLPLAYLPAGWVESRLHGVRYDGVGRPLLEDAWIEP